MRLNIQFNQFRISLPELFGSIGLINYNRMVRIFTFCCCLLMSVGCLAQSTTYIGAEVAYSADFFKISDPGGRVTHPDISSALWGATIRHTLSKHLFLEGGIYTRAYKLGLAFDHSYGSSGTDRTGYLVPACGRTATTF